MSDLSVRIAEEIKNRLDLDVDVEMREVVKTNGIKLEGYMIRKNHESVAPTIYRTNDSDDVEVMKIVETYENQLKHNNGESGMADFVNNVMTDPEKAYESIIPTLVGSEKNAENLDKTGIYHEQFLDMEIVYRMVLQTGPTGTASIQITNDIINRYGYDIEKIRSHALDHVLNTYRIQSMASVLRGMPGVNDEIIDMIDEEDPRAMFVARTTDESYGASIIISDEIMDKAHEKLKSDKIYILPSSLHEVLLLPADRLDMDVNDLRIMVKEVNEMQLAPDDILSYSVYVHTVEEGMKVA